MSSFLNRRSVTVAGVVLIVVAACAALASGSTSSVTRPRLERDLPKTFSSLYVQQAKILGHRGITVRSLDAKASCDKGGPDKPDVGPGADWICLMSWKDPNVPLPDGTAKFELNVHSNDCYTASGPSKYVGLLQITDTHGKQVDNPVFEFDSCFDPASSDAPTGVNFDGPASASLTPTQQRARTATVTLPTGKMAADAKGAIAPSVHCSDGKDGCAGTLTATVGGTTVTTQYVVPTDTTQPVTLPLPEGTTGKVALRVTPVIGTSAAASSTITVTH